MCIRDRLYSLDLCNSQLSTFNFQLKNMQYFLIAGDASGDLHASNLMAALKAQDAAADFRFLGGDLLQITRLFYVKTAIK